MTNVPEQIDLVLGELIEDDALRVVTPDGQQWSVLCHVNVAGEEPYSELHVEPQGHGIYVIPLSGYTDFELQAQARACADFGTAPTPEEAPTWEVVGELVGIIQRFVRGEALKRGLAVE